MSLSKVLKELIAAGEGNYQDKFKKLDEDVQIAIYQKLLYKAGEAGKESDAQKALNSLNDAEFQRGLPKEVQAGIKIEEQRYAIAKANAIYQDYLQQKVFENAVKPRQDHEEVALKDDLLFDPQGRLVYELTLSAEEQKEVRLQIEEALGAPSQIKYDNLALGELLGRTPTETTLCSIDLTGTPPTEGGEVYKKLKSKYDTLYQVVGIKEIPSHQRASIVASFEETYAHMSLMARTYESRSITYDDGKKISEDVWQNIRHNAAQELQKEVVKAYQRAAIKAKDSNDVVDVDELNKNLAKERTKLANFAKKSLIEGVVGHLKEQGAERKDVLEYMQKLSSKVNKHKFTERTATGYDYFYTSDYLQQGMLITGTEDTAHKKPRFKQGGTDQAAYRRVTYTYRDEEGVLQPTSAVSARIPSPALVFHGMSDNAIREDLINKYAFLHDEMRAMRGGKEGPVVEHLFTSFHSAAFERVGDNNNRQRASALYMMQAMHDFNGRQDNNNFLYMQNIGTNRHTRDLGYQVDRSFLDITGSVEMDDITLSAEMAMLHSLQENSAYLSPKIKEQIFNINKQVLENYNFFLKQQPRPTYFAESDKGLALIADIREFKKELKKELKQQEKIEAAEDLPSLASNALAKMIATNQHWDIRYGQLSQALSMYIEWASTGGCKSGNERNQDVMLRFALLKSIHERVEHAGNTDGLQDHERAIYDQLKAYAKGQTADPDALRASIAVSVRECNMHGGAAAISREDQGGAAKVSSFSFVQDIKSPFLRWAARIGLGVVALATLPLLLIPPVRKFYIAQLIDTNNAADREMHLDATGASKTQAHKGQDKRTRDVVLEVLKGDDLFKGKDKLTSEEKAGFKEDKKSTKGSHGLEIHSKVVVLDPHDLDLKGGSYGRMDEKMARGVSPPDPVRREENKDKKEKDDLRGPTTSSDKAYTANL